jgi:hypothetical protein
MICIEEQIMNPIMLAMETWQFVLLVIVLLTILIPILIVVSFIKIWTQALVSGAPVNFFQLFGMYLRKVPPQLIITARISMVQAGIRDIDTAILESIYLVRRNPDDVMTSVNALIVAQKAELAISIEEIQKLHFAGRDVVKMVQDRIDGRGPAIWEGTESINTFHAKSGRTVSKVYSAGIVEIEGQQYNAVAENEVIEENTSIQVSQVEGNYLVIVPA